MRPRTALLRQPHMAHLAEHPSLAAMDDATLAALEAFMAFCAAKGLTNPGEGDFAAFAALENRSAEELDRLVDALSRLGLPEGMLDMLRATRDARASRAAYAVRPPGPLPQPKARRVSLRVNELPEDWQATLGRLRAAGAFAPSILDRMEQRLGMFGWSARKAGHPIDLACADARHALTEDLTERSVRRGDGAEPRYAYLRSAWEEMLRFATAHGYDQATLTALRAGYEHLARREARQDPLKMAKIHRAGTSSGLLRTALDLLAAAGEKPTPNKRHWARNDAAAIGLGAVIPARAGDVYVNHVLGRGITYETATDQYRFRYVPQKSGRNRNPTPLDLILERHFNPFIEALILQDNDPAYLEELRAAAIARQRPLYVRPDGLQCPYGWYGRAWTRHAGTGGHIARTLINDEFAGGPIDEDEIRELGFDPSGEFAVQVGMSANHHSSPRTRDKYRSDLSKRKNYRTGQATMLKRAAAFDDISDL